MSRRPRRDPQALIDCGTAEDAYLVYCAAFRYAFGRMTYMPGVVIEVIKRNAATLTDECLALLDRELTEEAERYERAWKGKTTTNYGMECDRLEWLAFHEWVKGEIAKRARERGEGAK